MKHMRESSAVYQSRVCVCNPSTAQLTLFGMWRWWRKEQNAKNLFSGCDGGIWTTCCILNQFSIEISLWCSCIALKSTTLIWSELYEGDENCGPYISIHLDECRLAFWVWCWRFRVYINSQKASYVRDDEKTTTRCVFQYFPDSMRHFYSLRAKIYNMLDVLAVYKFYHHLYVDRHRTVNRRKLYYIIHHSINCLLEMDFVWIGYTKPLGKYWSDELVHIFVYIYELYMYVLLCSKCIYM